MSEPLKGHFHFHAFLFQALPEVKNQFRKQNKLKTLHNIVCFPLSIFIKLVNLKNWVYPVMFLKGPIVWLFCVPESPFFLLSKWLVFTYYTDMGWYTLKTFDSPTYHYTKPIHINKHHTFVPTNCNLYYLYVVWILLLYECSNRVHYYMLQRLRPHSRFHSLVRVGLRGSVKQAVLHIVGDTLVTQIDYNVKFDLILP